MDHTKENIYCHAWDEDITLKARLMSRNQEKQSASVQNQKEQAETNYPHLFPEKIVGCLEKQEPKRVPIAPESGQRQEHREGNQQPAREQVGAIKSNPHATAKPARQRLNRRRSNPAR
jgi:hypothetical protein